MADPRQEIQERIRLYEGMDPEPGSPAARKLAQLKALLAQLPPPPAAAPTAPPTAANVLSYGAANTTPIPWQALQPGDRVTAAAAISPERQRLKDDVQARKANQQQAADAQMMR